jgi:ABC-type lipoprotein release transport system permease subunit
MLSLLLGWRSFVRHKRRSIITVAAIALSLAMMLTFKGIADDAHARMAEMGIRFGAGHVLVQGDGYQLQQTLDQLIPDPAHVVEVAERLPAVTHAAIRVRAGGLLSAGELSQAVMVSGVQPSIEPSVSTIASAEKRVRGDYLRRRQDMEFVKGPADVYVGDTLAANLEVGVGDRVVLTVSPKGKSQPTSAALVVRGVFHSGLTELDQSYIEIPLAEAQQILQLGAQATHVAVLIDDLDASDATAAALQSALGSHGELEVLSWKLALRELYEAIVLDDMGLYLMMAIIFIIVAIGIFNTVLMSVTERTREMGVMMAIGTSKWRLFSIVMSEAAVLALVACMTGMAIGLALHWWVAGVGIDVVALAGDDVEFAGIAFSGRIYSRLTVQAVAKWTGIVAAMVVASAIYPALRTMRLEPVEAMRHV